MQKTEVVRDIKNNLEAYGTIELRRDLSDKEANTCAAHFILFIRGSNKPFRVAKEFSEATGYIVGIDLVGFSDDHSKLAADFWWAAGDYTGHRPVILDVNTDQVRFRELEGQITGQLPSCDYFQQFVGVTNSGEAIIHVPKSTYVEDGCPDQGEWLFNLQTGTVRRGQPSKSPNRASPRSLCPQW